MKFGFLTKNVDHGDFASRTAIVATIATATVAATLVLWKLVDLLPMVSRQFSSRSLGAAAASASPRVSAYRRAYHSASSRLSWLLLLSLACSCSAANSCASMTKLASIFRT